jgi:hypothetical protein
LYEVALGKGNDPDLLFAALTQMQLSPWRDKDQPHRIFFGASGEYIDTKTGQSQLSSYREQNEIRRSYSAQVIQSQARKFGWQLKKTGAYSYEVTKR